MTTAYAIFSISEYNNFDPFNASEMKYMGTCVNAPFDCALFVEGSADGCA